VNRATLRRGASLAVLFLAAVVTFAAARPAAEQAAIDWLISQVKTSEAVFIRNGVEYNGEKAAAHLKSKLFLAGKRVQTARQFIVGIASRSETSGKPYEIRGKDGVQQPLEKWLLEKLAAFEKDSGSR
jgi:uncharacterized protein DUF5329